MKKRNYAKLIAMMCGFSLVLGSTVPAMAEEETFEEAGILVEETLEEAVEEVAASEEEAIEEVAASEEEAVLEEVIEEIASSEETDDEEVLEEDVQGEGNVITIGDCTAALSDGASGAEVTVSENNYASVTIKKAGDYTITGSGSNVYIQVKKETTGVNITLDNLTLDNSGLYEKLGSDESSVSVKSGAQATLKLSGDSVITSPSGCKKEMEAALKASSSTLTIDGTGSLTLVSPDASAISAKYGRINIEGGTLNINDCGDDAIKAKGGSIHVDGGILNVDSCAGDCLKAKADSESTAEENGYVYITGGDLNFTKCKDDGVQAEYIYVSGGELDIETWYVNAATAYYVNGQYTEGSSDTSYNYIWKNSSMGGGMMSAPGEDMADGAPGGPGGDDSGMPGGPGGDDSGMPGGPGGDDSGMPGGQNEVKSERININLGSHKGLKGGTKAATETFTDNTDSEGNAVSDIVTESSGGVFISGGTINIDTTKSGLKANSLATTVYRADGVTAYSKDQGQDTAYIVGSPDDGIKSQNVVEITGGSVTINASDDGISALNTVTITGDAKVDVQKAYEGIEAAEINIGTKDSADSPEVTVNTCDDGMNASGKTLVYTYDSYTGYEADDEKGYVKQSTSVGGNKFSIYGGKLTVKVLGGTKTTNLPDGSYDNLKTVSYGTNGDGIDCNGSFYMYGGEAYIYDNSGNSESPIDQDNGLYYYGGTLLGAGYPGMGSESVPEYGTGAYFTLSKSFSANDSFVVKNGDTEIYNGKLLCSGSFIIFGSDGLGSSASYTLGSNTGSTAVTVLNSSSPGNPESGNGKSSSSSSSAASGTGNEDGKGSSSSSSAASGTGSEDGKSSSSSSSGTSGTGNEDGKGSSSSSSGTSGTGSEDGKGSSSSSSVTSGFEISGSESVYYTGAKITLDNLIINGARIGEKLKDSDIIFSRVKYKNNRNAGTAYAIPVLKAAKGADATVKKAVKKANAEFKANPITFTIKERPLSDLKISGKATVKKANKVSFSLTTEIGGRSVRLNSRRDFSVKSINESTGTVTIEGTGNFSGTAEISAVF